MPRRIDYFFTISSPWSFIGHAPFMEVALRHGVEVAYRPVATPELFPQTGGQPLGKRHPFRQAHRLMELQRWRDARGLKLNPKPKHFPFDASLADRTVIAILQAGQDPDAFMRAGMSGVWEKDLDLADPETVGRLAREAGYDADALLAAAQGERAQRAYADNLQAALDAGVFGVPSYVLDGEVFWGQDRVGLLDAALTSGRAPYTAETAGR